MRYFAYGSNMNPNRMKNRGAAFTERERGILKGYFLRFNKKATGSTAQKGEGKGNIERDLTGASNIEGALYTIEPEGLDRLDFCEGYPEHYNRKEIDVYLDDGSKVKAWVYIARPNMVVQGLKPTKEYLSHYLEGKDLLSPHYYQCLQKTETLD